MHSFNLLTTIAGSASFTYASPTPQISSDTTPQLLSQGLTVDQVHVGYKLMDGPTEMLKTYAKFGQTPPSHIVDAASRVTLPKWLASPPVVAGIPKRLELSLRLRGNTIRNILRKSR